MAKKRKGADQPRTNDVTTLLTPGAKVGFRRGRGDRGVENAALGFAEDLGRFLGTTQKKAEEWLAQRKSLAQQLTQIREAANSYLQQLRGTGDEQSVAVRRGRRVGRPAGSKNKKTAAESAGTRKRTRRPMTAAQRKAVGERMKKYWAEQRKAKK